MYYPGGMKAQVSPVQLSEPYSILAPNQNSNPGGPTTALLQYIAYIAASSHPVNAFQLSAYD